MVVPLNNFDPFRRTTRSRPRPTRDATSSSRAAAAKWRKRSAVRAYRATLSAGPSGARPRGAPAATRPARPAASADARSATAVAGKFVCDKNGSDNGH